MSQADKILAINCGSSSVKAQLFSAEDLAGGSPAQALWNAKITWDDDPKGLLTVSVPGRREVMRSLGEVQLEVAIKLMLNQLWSSPTAVVKSPTEIKVIGHRVVHGGTEFTESTVINTERLHRLSSLSDLAPLHQPRCVQGISACRSLFAHATQVAVFDTAFHATLPPEAYIYPVPYEWFVEWGVRRYGFHGINHAYTCQRGSALIRQNGGKLRSITCHLGAGCSLTAELGGKSVRTTMGFTPLEGLMMATRSGSIDPGILLYLTEHHKLTPHEIDQALNRNSGFLGVSGFTADVKQILQAASEGDKRSQLAIDIFVDRTSSCIASLVPAIGGLDLLVFSGGIGENSAVLRQLICERLSFLGVSLDEKENAAQDDRIISDNQSKVKVCVVHAHEELQIAAEAMKTANENFPAAAERARHE